MKTKMKFSKKILSIMLCMAMVLSFMPAFSLTASADSSQEACDESGCSGIYENGFCTVCDDYEEPAFDSYTDTYEIANAGQLYWFADKVNTGEGEWYYSARLTNDITVNEKVLDENENLISDTSSLREWTPIGTIGEEDSVNFTASTFDGRYYTISGLYLEDSVYASFFGLTHGARLQNIILKDSYFGASVAAGLVCAPMDTIISNCYTDITVVGTKAASGIAYRLRDSEVIYSGASGRCIYTGEDNTDGCVAGLVTECDRIYEKSYIRGCYFNGTLEEQGDAVYAGAFVARIKYSSVENSVYIDTVSNANGPAGELYWDSYTKRLEYSDTFDEPIDYYFDEDTVLAKSAADFASGSVCEYLGIHPGVESDYPYADMQCCLCSKAVNEHIPVTDIENTLPGTVSIGEWDLPSQVTPADASKQTIEWSVLSGNAEISGSKLKTKGEGTIKLRATVKNGDYYGWDYTQDFTVVCAEKSSFDISEGPIVIEKYSDTEIKITQTVKSEEDSYPEDVVQIQNKDVAVWITGTGTDGVMYADGFRECLITVKENTSATVLLDNCHAGASGGDCSNVFSVLSGAAVKLVLSGDNSITATAEDLSGIYVHEDASLEITGTGSLAVTVEQGESAGIGGNSDNPDFGVVTISSGTVTVINKGFGGAAIGGGEGGNGTIYIKGGTVNATAANSTSSGWGAAIGSGSGAGASKIYISGGTVTATMKGQGSAIGAGRNGSGDGVVEISGGTVNAANTDKIYGDAIGGSDYKVTISGGTLIATAANGSEYTNGIHGKDVIISGGTIKASSINVAPVDANGNPVVLYECTIMGVTDGTAVSSAGGAEDYGFQDVKTIDNKLYLYLKENSTLANITGNDKVYADDEGDLIFCNHESLQWSVYTEATCYNTGVLVYGCSICGYHEDIYETVAVDGPYPESSHPRAQNCDETQKFTVSGAIKLSVAFSENTSVMYNFDFIYIYDATGKLIDTFTGKELAGKTIEISSNAISVRLVSKDTGVDYYGYAIDSVSAVVPVKQEHVSVIPMKAHTYVNNVCSVCGDVDHIHN